MPLALTEWPASDGSRYAGVSSFGFGGTNAHIVVGEAPPVLPAPAATRSDGEVLMISARTEPALRQMAARYGKMLSRDEDSPWLDVCRTAALGRSALPHRLAVFAAHSAEAAERLGAFARGDASGGFRQGSVAERPRVAFLFSGQGSPWRGMGQELHAASPVYRAAFEECRSLVKNQAGWDLSEVVSSDDRFAGAEYGQVGLFAVQFALGRVWAEWGVVPDAVVGHSVGEYAAACAAGVLGLDEAVKLLLARARIMGELGNTGAMAAVQGSEGDVAAALARHGVEIGAINGPRQVVLTGNGFTIAAAAAELTAAGYRVGLLGVNQAYHSRKMEPVLEPFAAVAAGVSFRPPQCIFVSSVTGRSARDELTKPDYWVQQIRRPVLFGAAMDALKEERIDLLIEIGPRATLLALGQQVWPAGTGEWLPSLRPGRGDLAQMRESAGRAWVRGTPVDWRRVHAGFSGPRVSLPTYPFERQRHWFDELPSVQRHSFNEAALNRATTAIQLDAALTNADREAAPRILAAFFRQQKRGADGAAVGDSLYELKWLPQPRLAAGDASVAGNWLIVGPLGPVASHLAGELNRRGQTAHLANNFEPGVWRGVVFIAGAADEAESGCHHLLAAVKALLQAAPSARLWIVTCGAIPALADDAQGLALEQSPLWGFGRVIALEHPEIWGGLVDLPAADGPSVVGALVEELLGRDGEDQVALRQQSRFVLRLERRDLPESTGLHLRADATYWVTGGLGALGLKVAHWLVHHGARQLMLTGRSSPSAGQEAAIALLRGAGARVLTLQADAAEPGDVQRALAEAAGALGPVRGIVHTAGIVAADPLASLTPASLDSVLRPKVAGAWALHEATLGMELDFFVLFSSIAAVWGAKHQAHYAAANSYLDALAHYRRAHGLQALSVNWGPWAEGGMADAKARSWLARSGVSAMPSEETLAALDILLSGRVTQATVARVDWSVLRELFELRGPRALFARLSPEAAPAVASMALSPSQLVEELRAVPSEGRRPRLVAFLQAEVGAVLGFREGRRPDTRQGFFALGMDSLMAVELRNRLAQRLARRFPATLALDHANIEALADHLCSSILGLSPLPAAPSAPGTDGSPASPGGQEEPGLDAALAARLARLEALVRKA